ncbi:UbiA family prenyltransferase [uncultured Mediterranea sp.]|uniref:prenyltransferase n=1 Tax=uncultured Mediterranea sp. TaxID=1926662 RepID=UPI0027D99340|nr:UbiA family prenyltransferase [uncultured Mediterranea sp.]
MNKHSLKDWLVAVRPWSFPASAMPVAVTLAFLYWMQQDVNWTNGVWALLNIIVFHAAGNTWSDYFDYKHRVDREDTHGVRTLTGGLFRPQEIFRLSLSLLVVALVAGIGLLVRTGLPLLYIGIGGAACTLLYPALKYRALGDVVIFVAYALLPMLGTAYVATGVMDWTTMWAGVPVGLITVAILHANNTRDITTDVRADIRTLAMTVGAQASMAVYYVEVLFPFVWIAGCAAAGIFPWWTLLVLPALVPAVGNVRLMSSYSVRGMEGISRLDELTAKLQLLFSLLLTLSFVLARVLS